MDKISAIAVLLVLVLLGTPVLAQDASMMQARNGAAGRGMPPMVTKEKIDQSMQILLQIGLLYKMLGQPTMVSTDNGIIVAYGNTLRKYDKDLNLIKEVELDVDADAMQDLSSKLASKYSSKIMDLMGGMTGSPSKSVDDQKEEEIKKEIEQMK